MPKLFTIGHSTRTLLELISLLKAHGITHLIDVRSIPKSRRVPWFNKKSLSLALRKEKIIYSHFPELGGLRRTSKNSINAGWHNASFRGFADYMQTAEFYSGIKKLNQLLKRKNRVAVMCAEAVPWRCHRSLIGDAEVVRGITVWDIMGAAALHEHHLTPFAVVNRNTRPIKIYYPK
jgi:uncharacterized protein (DUF488 family)